jgi:hypothetical protein
MREGRSGQARRSSAQLSSMLLSAVALITSYNLPSYCRSHWCFSTTTTLQMVTIRPAWPCRSPTVETTTSVIPHSLIYLESSPSVFF